MRNAISLAVVTIISVIVTGCATNSVNLVKDETLSVKTESCDRLTITRADIYQDGSDTVISGEVMHNMARPDGLIYIDIIASEGVAYKQVTATRHYPYGVKNVKVTSTFTYRLRGETLPKGYSVKIHCA